MKLCIKCFENKEIFYTANVCMDCYRERKRLYNEKHKERNRKRVKERKEKEPEKYRDKLDKQNAKSREETMRRKELDKINNPEKYRQKTEEEIAFDIEQSKAEKRIYAKNYRENNKEKVAASNKNWRESNVEYVKEIKQEYYEKNRERDRDKRRLSNKNYIENNPKAKFCLRLRCSVNAGFRNYSKNGKTKSCAEYGIDFEAIYNKIGPKPEGNYHLDHIIPMSVFDFDIYEHVRMCNSPENLRWVLGKENLEKWNKIYVDLIEADEKLIYICEVIGLDINKYKKENNND